jgi:hypothetical protein
MDTSFLQEITKILTEFAATKFTAQVLEVKGPVLEGSNYRWRIISNRFREVTVVLATKKPFFGKPAPVGIEVHGLGETKSLPPNLKDLQDFLGQAQLTAIGDL